MRAQPVQTLLTTLVRGRRLELLELLLLIWFLPRLVAGLGLAGLGALALGDATVALTCRLVRRAPRARRPSPVAATAFALVIVLTTAFVGHARWVSEAHAIAAAEPAAWMLCVLSLVAAGTGARLRTLQRLASATAGTTRAIRGGGALLRIGAAAALAGQTGGVLVIAGVWMMIDWFSAGLAATSATRGGDNQAGNTVFQRPIDAEGSADSAAATTTLWHLDEVLIAALIGVAGVAPWAIGAWIAGRLMSLSALLERAALPLPIPGVPLDYAWRRTFEATVGGAMVLAVPMVVFSPAAARTWFGVDAPWLGLFGVVLVLAAAGRAAARGMVAATVAQRRDAGLAHLLGAVAAVTLLGPPGALLATALTLAVRAGQRLRTVYVALPLAFEQLPQRGAAVLGPAFGGALVGVVMLTAKPPTDALSTLAEMAFTTIVTGVGMFATYQLTDRR